MFTVIAVFTLVRLCFWLLSFFQKVMFWLFGFGNRFVFNFFSNLVSLLDLKVYLSPYVCVVILFLMICFDFQYLYIIWISSIFFDSWKISSRDDDLRLFTLFGYSSSCVSYDFLLINLDYKRYLNIFQFGFVFVHILAS